MKRIKLLIIIFICLFIGNVYADTQIPKIIAHKVMVTNKNGTVCYENGNKTDKIIPYGTTLDVERDISGSYIYVSNKDYSCNVKYSDVSSKTQSFDINSEGVANVTPVKAIVLANGLNMRKGPSVTYSAIVTIPKYTIVTLTRSAGTFWYYTEYKEKSGWITAMNGYIGFEGKNVLYNYQPTKIYSSPDKKAVLGTIPANTEITNYLELSHYLDTKYYIEYNGTKGYIESMFYKTEASGVIKLTKDVDIRDEDNNLIKKLTANQELKYTMINENNEFYFADKKMVGNIPEDSFEYIQKAKVLVKKSGYIGEGIFGEEKLSKEEITTPTEEIIKETENEEIISKKDNKQSAGISTKELIIICLLAGIFLALTALVIIKLVNRKKKVSNTNLVEQKKTDLKPEVNSINNELEIEKARQIIEKRMQSELNNQTNNENKEV